MPSAPTARLVAAQALIRCGRGGYSQLVLDAALKRAALSSRDAAFASALFYGALERRVTLDHCIAHYARRPLSNEVQAVLELACYQLLYLDSVPQHAAVSEAVDSTRALAQSSAAGLVNGILRAFLRDGCAIPPTKNALECLRVEHSCGEAVARRLLDWYGPARAAAILAASLGRAPVFLRVNRRRNTPAELTATLAAEGVTATPGPIDHCLVVERGDVAHTKAHRDGLFHIQDVSSQQAALALGAMPGERLLDVCAAPGSKSFVLAQQLDDRGEILARDLSDKRLRLVDTAAKRLGLTCIATSPGDGQVYDESLGLFDGVLCDAPCSGLGVLRRKPEIKYRGDEAFAGLPDLQYKILATSSHYCKVGGRLVYSTCTVSPEENEQVIARFLDEHPAFSAEEQRLILPDAAGGDGFFICRMRRSL